MIQKDDHPFKVTARTLAGFEHVETVKPDDIVYQLTDKAVAYFESKGELVPGNYEIVPLNGTAALDPTSTLRAAGVTDGAVLVLKNREPQMDG